MNKAQQDKGENFGLILLLSIVATIGGFLFGFDSGVINGTVDGLQDAFNSDSAGTGFNVASMLLGCALGAFFAGRLADMYGRRSLLIVAALFFIVSAWGSGVSGSSLEFVIYRVLGGLAVGAASVMSPAYISEIAPARIRGRLATIQQIAIISGLFLAFVSNYFLAKVAGASTSILWAGHEAWRWMFWVEIFPAAIFFFGLLAIPESPRFLVASGKNAKAKAVLIRLYGNVVATAKVDDIDRSLAADHHQPKLNDLVDKTTGRIRKIVWVGIGLASFQQFVGINVVFFNFSWGPVMWVMLGEMYPNQIRGSGLAVSGFAQWTSNFAITLSFPILLTSIGLATAYGFYSICALLSLIFVYRLVHETRGIELEDMEG